jgi:hypothetical protein
MTGTVRLSSFYSVVVDTSKSLGDPATPPRSTLVLIGGPGLDDDGHPLPLDVSGRTLSTQVSGNHTFVITGAGSEIGKIVESTGSSKCTFTIPSGIPEGSIIEVFQYGAGQVTIASAGPSIISDGGKTATAGQYATIGIRIRTGGSEAVLSGDLVAAP